MVYDDFNNGRSTQWEELQAADSIKLLGKGVIKVVQRVDEAKENNCLGMKYLKVFKYSGKFNSLRTFLISRLVRMSTSADS